LRSTGFKVNPDCFAVVDELQMMLDAPLWAQYQSLGTHSGFELVEPLRREIVLPRQAIRAVDAHDITM
jgi:hypothetical protein